MLNLIVKEQNLAAGETVEVKLSWSFEEPPAELVLRLFWYTEGKGTRDVGVVEERKLPQTRGGEQEFRLTLTKFPYSIHGRLVSVCWAVEAIARPSGESVRQLLVVGPAKAAVRLATVERPAFEKPPGYFKFFEKYVRPNSP